jgi:hypothetical protein
MNHAIDHRRDLGGGWRFELGVNAQRIFIDVPVDHHAAAPVMDVPLRGEVLIPGAEMLVTAAMACRKASAAMYRLWTRDRKAPISNYGVLLCVSL